MPEGTSPWFSQPMHSSSWVRRSQRQAATDDDSHQQKKKEEAALPASSSSPKLSNNIKVVKAEACLTQTIGSRCRTVCTEALTALLDVALRIAAKVGKCDTEVARPNADIIKNYASKIGQSLVIQRRKENSGQNPYSPHN